MDHYTTILLIYIVAIVSAIVLKPYIKNDNS